MLTLPQVPEHIQSILTDSNLHNGTAKMTTEQILTRYGDIARGLLPAQRNAQAPDAPAQTSVSGTSNRPNNIPLATRVDVDPYQTNAWQKQSTVRHVQAPGVNSDSAGKPSQEFGSPDSPVVRERAASVGSQGSHGPAGNRRSDHMKPETTGVVI